MKFRLLIVVAIALSVTGDENQNTEEDKLQTFPKKMLARRREEHLVLLKNIALNPKYEWRFKLVEVGVTKVFELINENRAKLKDDKASGRAEQERISEAKMIVIENACLLMDFIVNFKEDIYKIFTKISRKHPNTDWRAMLQLSFDFLKREEDLLDELTTREYQFIVDNWEKLDAEETLPDYPYENSIKRDIDIAERLYEGENEKLRARNKREKKKKLKKGPALRGSEL